MPAETSVRDPATDKNVRVFDEQVEFVVVGSPEGLTGTFYTGSGTQLGPVTFAQPGIYDATEDGMAFVSEFPAE